LFRRFIITSVLLITVGVFFSCVDREFSQTPRYKGVYALPPDIRVLLLKDGGPERKIYIETSGRFLLTSSKGMKHDGKRLHEGLLKVDRKGVHIGPRCFGPGYLKLSVDDGVIISINNKQYRGSLLIIPRDPNRFMIINVLDLENYLRGVIPHEVPATWPQAALNAQAIASRSFALWRIKTRSKMAYDVTSDIYSQVYGGSEGETVSTDRAVAVTRGIAMLYGKKLFPAYFHSCCGGHTANAFDVWGEYKMPPLAGVKSEYCQNTKAYSWRQHFTEAFIIKAIRKANPRIKLTDLSDIVRIGVGPSGHASRVKLVYSGGEYEISGDALRKYLGRDKHSFLALRSTNFTVARRKKQFWFLGKGNGHGVGMCQWCALEMAKNDKSATEILEHFYAKAELWTLWD